MSFTGNESESVTLTDASNWTRNFRDANPEAIKAHFFGKNKLMNILNQTGCVGIRMYHGIDDAGAAVMILVGVNSNEGDLTSGTILERSQPCPPYCDVNSALMK